MRFRRPTRRRRVAKWLGLTLCLLIGIVWLANWLWIFGYASTRDVFEVSDGAVLVALGQGQGLEYRGWFFDMDRSLGPKRWWPLTGLTPVGRAFIIPLWIPLLAIGVPTFLLWRKDRGFPKGHCQRCGYDLTGNQSGVCPECGSEIEKS